MPRVCTICNHAERSAIDDELVKGTAFRIIAERYGTSLGTLFRHRDHTVSTIAKAKEAADVARGDTLLDKMRGLEEDARRIARKAEETDDFRTAIASVRELTRIVELQGKLAGELDDRPQIAVMLASPEWGALRARLLVALEPFPEARVAAAAALEVSNAGR